MYVLLLFNTVVLKNMVWGPLGGSLRPFQWVHNVKIIFHNNIKVLFVFSLFYMYYTDE